MANGNIQWGGLLFNKNIGIYHVYVYVSPWVCLKQFFESQALWQKQGVVSMIRTKLLDLPVGLYLGFFCLHFLKLCQHSKWPLPSLFSWELLILRWKVMLPQASYNHLTGESWCQWILIKWFLSHQIGVASKQAIIHKASCIGIMSRHCPCSPPTHTQHRPTHAHIHASTHSCQQVANNDLCVGKGIAIW